MDGGGGGKHGHHAGHSQEWLLRCREMPEQFQSVR